MHGSLLALKATVLATFALISIAGLGLLADYSSRAGPISLPNPTISPNHSKILPSSTVSPTIVLFYHPKCPCTVATARSLARLYTKFVTPPHIVAFAFCPAGEAEKWIESPSTKVLRKVPNLDVRLDFGGKMCSDFGVCTSGHFLVYSAEGQLLFSGGITPYRGHEGDSRASTALVNCINESSAEFSNWPVFGCLIAYLE